jgi:hypothetical protein
MRWLPPLAMLGLACLTPRPATANQFMDGNQLLQLCMSQDPYNGMECTGYVKGVADAFSFQMDAEKRVLCMPDGVTAKQLVDATVKWLQENTPEREYPAVATVGIAIAKTWKCDQ